MGPRSFPSHANPTGWANKTAEREIIIHISCKKLQDSFMTAGHQ